MNLPADKQSLLNELLGALRENTISDEQVAELENLLADDEDALAYYVDHAQLTADLRHYHGHLAAASLDVAEATPSETPAAARASRTRAIASAIAALAALAASLVFLIGLPKRGEPVAAGPAFTDEGGLAVLTRVAGAKWNGAPVVAGQSLHARVLDLESGLAQVEFFRGAVVILEGPSRFELLSDDRARLYYGTLRSFVPPPAQGFVIETPQGKVIDHGTEFGLSVSRQGESEVHVFDGKVELQGNVARELTAGEGIELDASGKSAAVAARPESFRGPAALAEGADADLLRRRSRWAKHAEKLASDPSALVYFTFEHPDAWGRSLVDESSPGYEAAIVGSQWSTGRWPGKGALEFKRTTDRVRIDVPGEFDAFTLVAWIRFDGFDRWLSSPLLTDVYADGRPHWHVTWDGEIVLGIGSDGNYFSPKGLLGEADLGRWLHLATVVDPQSKTVRHYLDGRQVHQAPLRVVQKFRLGPAGVGNWSRTGVWKENDVRSLNGRLDEFGIFARVFTAEEIRTMYEQGK